MLRCPIGILSFNRPDYLDMTLKSLAPLVEAGREIHLFQDGGTNDVSDRVYAEPDVIERNIAVFRAHFPEGVIHRQDRNLGIARHFDVVERYFFEERGVEVAAFFEDDMALGPNYLDIMDRFLIPEAVSNERIGCVAAYGWHQATLGDQLARLSELVVMGHRWGFALTRRQWLRQKPHVDEYLALIAKTDYQQRDHRGILEWFLSKGLLPRGTSQDNVKETFSWMAGIASLMTFACHARYIGKVGVHFREQDYVAMGFAETELCPTAPDFLAWPDADRFDAMVKNLQGTFTENVGREKELFPQYFR